MRLNASTIAIASHWGIKVPLSPLVYLYARMGLLVNTVKRKKGTP